MWRDMRLDDAEAFGDFVTRVGADALNQFADGYTPTAPIYAAA